MMKKVVKAMYVHKSNWIEIQEEITRKDKKKRRAFHNFLLQAEIEAIPYDVIKYDNGDISLITSPDWDIANEPIVGTVRRWKQDEWLNRETEELLLDEKGMLNKPSYIRDNFKQIYHNKWQFVGEDYKGFNIEEAKERTKEWNAIPNLDKKRIGYKKYWMELLKENGFEL